jgi:putative protease
MSGRKSLPELLAPAGSYDSLVAAVAAGADAVYFGGTRFGARRFAENFGEQEIVRAIDYAHMHGVNAYITVNTLVHDRELPDLTSHLLWLYENGADAILVQDTGVASLAREVVPDLPLHASTQMTICSAGGVEWAATQGFSRVVLARELPISEIRDIAARTGGSGIGLEIFVHGALCYGYSGQCLLSSVMGGRSGNRGTCAQPCRKPYTLVSGATDLYGRPGRETGIRTRGAYLLSTKDLALYPRLAEVVELPVAGLKIEGRMRSPKYVALVTSIYRNALDAIGEGNWSPSEMDVFDLALAFNRGFTTGCFGGERHSRMMSRDRPDNRGIFIGMVKGTGSGRTEIRLTGGIVPSPGDGLVCIDPASGREEGLVLSGSMLLRGDLLIVPGSTVYKRGMEVYITRSAALSGRAEEIISRKPASQIPVDIRVVLRAGLQPLIAGEFPAPGGELCGYTMKGDFAMIDADRRPLTCDKVECQLRKAGGTPFEVRNVEIDYEGGLFAPIGALNKLRRDFLAGAEAALAACSRPGPVLVESAEERAARVLRRLQRSDITTPTGPKTTPRLTIYTDTIAGVRSAAEAGAETVCFEPSVQRRGSGLCRAPMSRDEMEDLAGAMVSLVQEAVSIGRPGTEIVWKWPAITSQAFEDAAAEGAGEVYDAGVHAVLLNGTGPVSALSAAAPGLLLYGGTGLNVFNHLTAIHLCPPFAQVTLSPELGAPDLERLVSLVRSAGNGPAMEVIAQGNLEVMITADCLRVLDLSPGPDPCAVPDDHRFLGIRDMRGRLFPVRTDAFCMTHIRNAAETCLVDHMPVLCGMGIDSVAIDARERPASYTREMTGIYRLAIDAAARRDPGMEAGLAPLKERAKEISLGGITAGHFTHGLFEDYPE